MISVRNLTRRYGSNVAVRDVSLQIARGEVVGLLGQNGAGKTTIMKVLTGFLEPSSGTVEIDGLDVVARRTEVQQRIGYLPENAPLYLEMLVQDYLLWLAELRGVPRSDRVKRVGEAVIATGLRDHLVRPIGTLSKGYRQRVGLAQAILHKPALLVLDEPTNGLDPVQILAIRALIRRLAENSTVIVSTHILQEIEAVCDRVVVLIGGELVADAPIRQLLGSSALSLVVPEGVDVAARLSVVEGVVGITRIEPGRWRVAYSDEAPTAAILRALVLAGVDVGGCAPEQVTLEAVFQRLQVEHAARQA
jgi:ABC-2 type transport system ATP-binding protein